MKTLIDVEGGKKRILTVLREELGNGWGKLNDKERELCERCAEDAAKLGIASFAAGESKSPEFKQLDAEFANLGVATALVVRKAFWRSVVKVFGVLHGVVNMALQGVMSGFAGG